MSPPASARGRRPRRFAAPVLLALAGLTLVSWTVAPRALGAADEAYALVGARILPVSGPAVESGTLVMRGGVIEAVGAGIAVPAGVRVIEARGLTLTPGLIDGFGGVGLPAAAPRPAAGASGPAATTPRAGLTPEAQAVERVRLADALKARDHGVTTALVIAPEGVLPGRSVLLNLSGESVDDMVLRQPAALHVHLRTLAGRYPNSLMGTMALLRQSLLDAARYREDWAAYEKAPAGRRRPAWDAGLEAWADVAAGRIPLVVTATRENDVRRALALADEFKVRVLVAGAPQAARLVELLRTRKLPLLLSVNFDPPRAAGGFGEVDEERERREIEEAEKSPAALHEAKVPFALVSGHAPSFLAGVRKAIERGLPAEAALRAVTLAAAEILGIADRTGSLDKGKIANVVAWSGDPLAKDAKVKMVFVDGQRYEPDDRPPPAAPTPAAEAHQ